MGDRTSVILTILRVHAERAVEIMGDEAPEASDEVDYEYVEYSFDEVNYGNLPFLGKLRDAGIAHDSTWADGSEYSAGTHYCLCTQNCYCIEKSIYYCDLSIDVNILMAKIDEPKELRALIIKHHETVKVLDFDDQEEYGKRYLAKKLIS